MVCRQLARIEQSVRSLKSLHDSAPVRDDRIKAHAFLRVLSRLLEGLLEQRLRASGLDMTARRALEVLGAMRLREVKLKGEGIPDTDRRRRRDRREFKWPPQNDLCVKVKRKGMQRARDE